MASSVMAVSKRMTPVNVFGFVRYDQGNSHPSTQVKRQGGAINSSYQFDTRHNSRRQAGLRDARLRVARNRGDLNVPSGHAGVIAIKLGGPTKIQNWGRNGEVTDVAPLTDLHYKATAASWHLGGGPLDPVLAGDGEEYAHAAQPVEEAKAELAEAMKPSKKAKKPRAKKGRAVKPKMPRAPRKFSKKGGFIFTKFYVPSVKT